MNLVGKQGAGSTSPNVLCEDWMGSSCASDRNGVVSTTSVSWTDSWEPEQQGRHGSGKRSLRQVLGAEAPVPQGLRWEEIVGSSKSKQVNGEELD